MISFIIPVYNKGSVLFTTLSSLIHRLHEASITDFEIIVVNDGSTDDTFAQAVKFKKFNGDSGKIRIFHYTKNVGKGFALRFGFSKSHGDPIVFLDGDMDIDTSQIISMLRTYDKHKYGIIIGSKYHPRSRTHYPLNRYLYSLILKIAIKFLFRLNVSDTQVGLKLFDRKVLHEVLPRLVVKQFAVDLELLVVAHFLGFTKIHEIPVRINHTSANVSSINLKAVKNFCQDIAAIWYRKNILNYYSEEKYHIVSPTFSTQAV